MSWEHAVVILNHSRALGTDRLILLGIANHAGDGGAWPSIETLARYGGNVTERTVQRSLKRLVELGEIVIHVQGGGPSGMPDWKRPNRYDLLLDRCPPNCDRSTKHRVTSLAAAPADLWITGVTPASPGDAHVTRGATPTSPGGATPTSPETTLKTTMNPGVENRSQLQSARDLTADVVLVRCSVCDGLEHDCRSRIAISGHEFEPRVIRPRASLERDDEQRSDEESA